MVAMLCKKCNRQCLDLRKEATRSHIVYLCAGCGSKWDVLPEGNPLAAFGCQLRDDGLWVLFVE